VGEVRVGDGSETFSRTTRKEEIGVEMIVKHTTYVC
jgi:hypothetical protein